MRRFHSPLVLTLAVLSALSAPVWSAPGKPSTTSVTAPVITFRTGQHPDFDRLVFDAPKGMGYKVNRQGSEVTVSFSRPAKVSLNTKALPRAANFQVVKGADGAENLVVRFTVPQTAVIKDFYSGSSIVFDVQASAKAALAQPPVAIPQVKEEKKEAPSPPPPMANEKAVVKPESPKTENKASQTPPPAKEVTPAKTENVKPETAIEKTTVAPAEISPTPRPPEKETKAPETQAAPATQPAPASAGTAPTPQAAPAPNVEHAGDLPEQKAPSFKSMVPAIETDPQAIAQIRSILKESEPLPVAVLDPKIPIGAAIFARGGYVTILFDRKLVGNSLISSPPPRLKLEPLELPHNTGFRIAIPSGVGVRATRKETAWEIYLVPAGREAALSTSFVAQPEFALGGRLLVPTSDPPLPIFFPDPVVGDDLVILPFRETGAFTLKRRLADFHVIPAAQGLIIKPMHEKVIARATADGIEITAEGGLRLSPSRDTGLYSDQAHRAGKVLYDFERWQGAKGESFSTKRQKLMQTIIDVSEDERILARLDLARFYLAHGMGKEALSILQVIEKKLPEINRHPDFLAIRGGGHVISGSYRDGFQDLSHPSLRDLPEAILWKAVAQAGMHDWNNAFEQFVLTVDLLEDYPEPFRSRFMVWAVESAAATGKDKKVADWLTRMEKTGYDSNYEPAIRYLRGVLYSKGGRTDMAEKLWRQVVKGSDRLYKIRAELALVDLGVATKSLTPAQAVDRLEGLRFAWRGDDLELDILSRLGGFYLEAKDYRKGFKMLSQAARLFPDAPQTPIIRAEMVKTFEEIYTTDAGKDVSPIEALELYTDYKTLIPAGEKGNEVRRSLAERLIDIDLLDSAVKLLEDLMKNSPTAEERVRTATRLAGVRLLDRKAQEALNYLDQSQGEAPGVSAPLQVQRQLLRVRALSELGKYTEALAAMPNNQDKSTKLLKADIAMRAKNWYDTKNALLDLVGPPRADKPLDEEQAGWLVSAAVAMAQSSDLDGLDKLGTDYGAAMASTSKAGLFKILTRPESMEEMKDLRGAQTRLSEVDMFRSVLDSYRLDGKK